MEWQKIKNAEQLLACGQTDARARVLELTDRVLAKLDQRVFLKNMIRRDVSKLCI